MWDDNRWRWDDTEAVVASAQETVEAMVSDAMTENNHQQPLSSARHAINSGARARIDAMLYLARPHLSVGVNDLDSDPMLFNAANGTLDLRMFKLGKMMINPGRLRLIRPTPSMCG